MSPIVRLYALLRHTIVEWYSKQLVFTSFFALSCALSLETQAPLMLPPHFLYFRCSKEGGAWSNHVWLLNLEHPEHINYSCLFN